MNYKKSFLTLFFVILIPFSVNAEEISLEGLIAVIDVEQAILQTEVSKQAFEELANSKEWKEVEDDLKLKINEANEIRKGKERGPYNV